MDKFKIKIKDIIDVEGAEPMVRFDVIKDDIVIGEAEAEYSVFSGILMGKWSSYLSKKLQNINTYNQQLVGL